MFSHFFKSVSCDILTQCFAADKEHHNLPTLDYPQRSVNTERRSTIRGQMIKGIQIVT